jgi:hypothetical protein
MNLPREFLSKTEKARLSFAKNRHPGRKGARRKDALAVLTQYTAMFGVAHSNVRPMTVVELRHLAEGFGPPRCHSAHNAIFNEEPGVRRRALAQMSFIRL